METETLPESAPETPPPAEVTPAPETPPPDPLATLREQNARLEGELAALRAQVTTPARPEPTRPQEYATPEEVEAAYQRGDLLEWQRQAWHGRVQARLVQAHTAEETRRADVQRRQSADLAAIQGRHPDLMRPGSELYQKVSAEYQRLVERGSPPDAATGLVAAENVVGRASGRDWSRRAVPSGAGGPMGGAPSAVPSQGYADVPGDVIAYWRKTGATEDDLKAYASDWRAKQARRRSA
jgi:hypothetical protein